MRLLAALLSTVLLLVLSCSPVSGQNAGIDRRFGDRGFASLRDPAQPANDRFLGLAACAAPGGGLNVLAAGSPDLLTLFRLDARGNLDASFERDGITTMVVPASREEIAHGACMADGRIVVARMAPGAGTDRNLHVFRVLPGGGLDATFGQAGIVTIDIDQHVAGLGEVEAPLGLNLDPNGDILVSMYLDGAGTPPRPGLVSLAPDGALRFARRYVPPGINASYASLAGLGPNGRLWLVGVGNPNATPVNSWFRLELEPSSGDLLATFVSSDSTSNYIIDGGRILANGVMVAAAKYVPQSEPGGAYRPRLLVFRESGVSVVTLPPPAAVNSFAPTMAPFPGTGVAIPIAEGRVLVGSSLGAQNQQWELATYAAVVEIGATAAGDRVDTRFGAGGATQFAFRTPAPCANGSPTEQRPVRFSNWRGKPVLAGIHATTCEPMTRNAFAARLLAPADIFMDTFED